MQFVASQRAAGATSTSGRSRTQQPSPRQLHSTDAWAAKPTGGAAWRTASSQRTSGNWRLYTAAPELGTMQSSSFSTFSTRRSAQDLEALRQTLAASLAAPEARPATQQDSTSSSSSNSSSSRAYQSTKQQDWHPSQGWKPAPHHLGKQQIWEAIKKEAKHDADSEPTLASFLYSNILVHATFEKALAFTLANKLASPTLFSTQLMKIASDAYAEEPALIEACLADLESVRDRDPACDRYTQCLLYFKGFQAIQCHRIAHHLWQKGRKALAVALQSRISEAFHVDIHPAAKFGRGILLDHATGVVIGETAVVGDNVSMLHHVTLGGSGTGKGIRHPTIGHGVLLGAGVTVLGPVTVGCGTKVGAGSVVVTDLPCHAVAVGVPARIIKKNARQEPTIDMDQCQDYILDFQI